MHPLLEQNQSTVLGRARNAVFASITGSLEQMPSDREVIAHIMARWKANAIDGLLHFHLLFLIRADPVEFPASLPAELVQDILARLNRAEVFHRIYAEGPLHGAPGTLQCGCLVLGHQRPNGEPGYYAYVFDDAHFLHGYSYVSIVPDSADEGGRIDELTSAGWEYVDSKAAEKSAAVIAALSTVHNHMSTIDPKSVDIATLRPNNRTKPPRDRELLRLLGEVYQRRTRVTSGTAPLDAIRPFSLEFCSRVSRLVDSSRIANGYRPELLIYWRDDSFVMSDDYLHFLAYRQLGIRDVPVCVIGNFPDGRVTMRTSGGPELLPPIGVAHAGIEPPRSPALEQWLLDQELRARETRSLPAELTATWLVFADLLTDKETTERQLHDYLLNNAVIIAPSNRGTASEVRLGKEYKIDLVIRSAGVAEEVLLVELESAAKPMFTRNGRPRKEVTHAKQQVEDWFRWIREHPDDPFVQSLLGVPPRGLVVIGRSRALSANDRLRLAHLNSNNSIPIITYDELLDRFGDLILQQCDDRRG